MLQVFRDFFPSAGAAALRRQHLLEAVAENRVYIVQELLAEERSLDRAVDDESRTLLHIASFEGALDVLSYLLATRLRCKINARDRSYRTPLHLAAAINDCDCIRTLVAGGAALEMRDEWGCTPLHLAFRFEQSNAAEELLRFGADPFNVDKSGRRALDTAQKSQDPALAGVVEDLLSKTPPGPHRGLWCALSRCFEIFGDLAEVQRNDSSGKTSKYLAQEMVPPPEHDKANHQNGDQREHRLDRSHDNLTHFHNHKPSDGQLANCMLVQTKCRLDHPPDRDRDQYVVQAVPDLQEQHEMQPTQMVQLEESTFCSEPSGGHDKDRGEGEGVCTSRHVQHSARPAHPKCRRVQFSGGRAAKSCDFDGILPCSTASVHEFRSRDDLQTADAGLDALEVFRQAQLPGPSADCRECSDWKLCASPGPGVARQASSEISQSTAGPSMFRYHVFCGVDVPSLGCEISWWHDLPTVATVYPGSEAEARGMVAGDQIHACCGQALRGMTRSETLPLLSERPLFLEVDRRSWMSHLVVDIPLLSQDVDGHEIQVARSGELIEVTSVAPHTTAWAAGLMPMDHLLYAGSRELATLPLPAVRSLLRERPLWLTVWRKPQKLEPLPL